jgi:hypothetical protein
MAQAADVSCVCAGRNPSSQVQSCYLYVSACEEEDLLMAMFAARATHNQARTLRGDTKPKVVVLAAGTSQQVFRKFMTRGSNYARTQFHRSGFGQTDRGLSPKELDKYWNMILTSSPSPNPGNDIMWLSTENNINRIQSNGGHWKYQDLHKRVGLHNTLLGESMSRGLFPDLPDVGIFCSNSKQAKVDNSTQQKDMVIMTRTLNACIVKFNVTHVILVDFGGKLASELELDHPRGPGVQVLKALQTVQSPLAPADAQNKSFHLQLLVVGRKTRAVDKFKKGAGGDSHIKQPAPGSRIKPTGSVNTFFCDSLIRTITDFYADYPSAKNDASKYVKAVQLLHKLENDDYVEPARPLKEKTIEDRKLIRDALLHKTRMRSRVYWYPLPDVRSRSL